MRRANRSRAPARPFRSSDRPGWSTPEPRGSCSSSTRWGRRWPTSHSQRGASAPGGRGCGLVAVVEGAGIVQTFRSLGADVVLGGPGHNPSVGEILDAIEAGPSELVVLPNHRNIVPAVREAASRSSKDVHVVPADSVPAGLSAAAAFNPASPLEDNAKAMEQAAAANRSGALARAERDAVTPAGSVKRGDWVGFAEDEPVQVGAPPADTAVEVTRRLAGPQSEVLTLVVGADA